MANNFLATQSAVELSISDINHSETDDEELTNYQQLEKDPYNSRENIKVNQNRSFSYFEIREIENTNEVLMKKVLAHTNRPKQYVTRTTAVKLSSAAVNRKKQQRKIDHDNLVLLKKIQSIKPFGLSKNK